MTNPEQSPVDPQALRRSRIKLLALMAVAFVPLFLAYFGYFYMPQMAPEGQTNQGELILPPVIASQLSPELTTDGRWTLILPVAGRCDDDCEQLLYLSRQVVTGLGKDSDRVGRLVAADPIPENMPQLLEKEHPDVRVVATDARTLRTIQPGPALFLMDPNGNIMMYFTLDKAGKPMLKDLKHLLRISNIG